MPSESLTEISDLLKLLDASQKILEGYREPLQVLPLPRTKFYYGASDLCLTAAGGLGAATLLAHCIPQQSSKHAANQSINLFSILRSLSRYFSGLLNTCDQTCY